MPDSVLKGLLKACQSGQFDLAHKEVTDIIAEGHPVSQIFSQVLHFSTAPFSAICPIVMMAFKLVRQLGLNRE